MKHLLWGIAMACWISAGAQSTVYEMSETDSIMVAIGDSIETSFANLDDRYFKEIFYVDALAKSVLVEEEGNGDLEAFNIGFSRNFKGALSENYAKTFIGSIERGGYFNFINYWEDELGIYYLRFRYFGEDGINYLEFVMEPVEGKYQITDVFNFLTGEFITETLKTAYLQAAPIKSNGGKMNEEIMESALTFLKLKEIKELFEKGDKEGARKMYQEEVPENMKQQRFAMNVELMISDIDDTEAYTSLLDRMADKSKNKASLYLISIDKFYFAEEFDKAHMAIDSLRAYTGDDMLDLFTGNIYAAAGDHANAIITYERLVANYPYLPEAYDALFMVYASTEDIEKFISALDRCAENLETDRTNLHDVVKDIYPEMVAKERYQLWLNGE